MKRYIIAFLIFLVLTISVTYPLILHLDSYSFGKGDELLITWILNWNIHSLTTNPLSVFNANIFFPYQNTLSFSEPFFSSTLLALIPTLIFKQPMIAYNVNVILSLAILGFSLYCLTFYITKNALSGYISGMLAAFSPFTLSRLFQLQVTSLQWLPFGILFFLEFLKKKQSKYLALSIIFFLLQTGNSFLTGYFFVLCLITIIIFHYRAFSKIFDRLITIRSLAIIGIMAVLLFFLGYPYFKTSKTFNYVRDIRDTIHFANRPEYTFYPNERTRLAPFILSTVYKQDKGPYRYDGYWGLMFLALFLFTIFWYIKTIRKQSKYAHMFLVIAIVSFILSMGPALQWGGKVIKFPFIIPLPYALLYYIVPGFKGIRNSARWEMLTIVAVSLFIATVYTRRFLKLKTRKGFVMILLIGLGIFAELNLPFSYTTIPKSEQFPEVYKYIKTLPEKSAIIHLPIYTWDMRPYSDIEFMREYFSTVNFRRTVNGYSGFSPAEWERNAKLLTGSFPDKTTIKYLKGIGVSYIIVHKNEYDRLYKDRYTINNKSIYPFAKIEEAISRFPQLRYIRKFNEDYIYEID